MAHSRSAAAIVLACGVSALLFANEGCSSKDDAASGDQNSGAASLAAGTAGAIASGNGLAGASLSGGALNGTAGASAGSVAGAASSAGAHSFAGAGGVTGRGGAPSSSGAGGARSSGGAPGTSGAGGAPSSSGAGGAPSSSAVYKGIANSPAAQISALGATWCYNWGTTPKSTDCADPLFVPMIWGSGSVASALKSIGKAGYKTVLGFNEPNKTDQANISVADAIAAWPDLTSDPNIRVGSPAVSDDGRAWLEDFMKQAKAKGLRVDFVAMHWYGWNKGSCVASQLEGAVKWASQWNLPVWITEFGCMGSSNPDQKTVLDFFNSAIPMLAKHPLVERYAWYPWNTYNQVYDSNAMTDIGKAFAAAPAAHP